MGRNGSFLSKFIVFILDFYVGIKGCIVPPEYLKVNRFLRKNLTCQFLYEIVRGGQKKLIRVTSKQLCTKVRGQNSNELTILNNLTSLNVCSS